MKNFVQDGDTCTFTAPYAVTSGGGFQVGSLFAVAAFDAASGATVEADLEGVFDLTKVSTGGGSGAVAGTKMYWDNGAKAVTKTATSNMLIGALVKDAADTDTTWRVRLNAVAV